MNESFGALNPAALARLLSVDTLADSIWNEKDLHQLLAHLMSLPLANWVSTPIEGLPGTASPVAAVRTLDELLSDPQAPAAGLRQVMLQAKKWRADPDRPIPEPIAAAIYFSASLRGFELFGDRMTSMPAEQWNAGIAWLRGQHWARRRTPD